MYLNAGLFRIYCHTITADEFERETPETMFLKRNSATRWRTFVTALVISTNPEVKVRRSSVTATQLLSSGVGLSSALRINEKTNKHTMKLMYLCWYPNTFICGILKYSRQQLAINYLPAKAAMTKMRKYRSSSACFVVRDVSRSGSSSLELGMPSSLIIRWHITTHF